MKFPEKYRHTKGIWGTKNGDNWGLFFIPSIKGAPLKVICAPSEAEWQHVSVSLPDRCPTWTEMCKVKNLFWDANETVVQFFPREDEYINNHRFCLHMWKHKDGHNLPPSILVGAK